MLYLLFYSHTYARILYGPLAVIISLEPIWPNLIAKQHKKHFPDHDQASLIIFGRQEEADGNKRMMSENTLFPVLSMAIYGARTAIFFLPHSSQLETALQS